MQLTNERSTEDNKLGNELKLIKSAGSPFINNFQSEQPLHIQHSSVVYLTSVISLKSDI
jgi:hypothetical protein